ncbi:uncharacterized protein LOC141628842 [Silene latifolia]|uniref:uncharacterized protein LOC141628842 n=1 Tax=Silene latifolia TaxID=37657 RepID=UPI003D76AED5
MFSRGDLHSVRLLLRAFETFFGSSGLKMNNGKSNIYSNGVSDEIMKSIEDASGVKRGGIPFRYLGVKIEPKRLGILDCQCLVDKVTERIARLGAKHLYYAGRLTLIKSVLSTLHNYWARIFILPKTVINSIDALFRALLWHGQEQKHSPALVSWNQICKPRRKGGLGLKLLHQWNVAMVGKYVWWVEQKTDHLWVKWVHSIYIKNINWRDYEPTLTTSWAWRRIFAVKTQLKPWLCDEAWRDSGSAYAVKFGYNWLVDAGPDVAWYPWRQNRIMLPKHNFFIWLVAHKRLLTQDRLMKMHITQSNRCYLCDADEEELNHLFFNYPFSRQFVRLLEDWLNICLPCQGVIDWWLAIREHSLVKKQVVAAAVAHLMYLIWQARNRCRIESVIPLHVLIIKQVKDLIQWRLRCGHMRIGSRRAENWVNSLCQNL